MSVVYCAMLTQPDTYTEEAAGTREYTHEWLVKTNDKTDGLISVRQGSLTGTPHPIPSRWSTYVNPVTGETDSGVILQSKKIERLVQRDDDYVHWKVTCVWSPLTVQGGGGVAGGANNPPDENPINWEPEFSIDWASRTKFIQEDIYGRKFENTAHTAFDPLEIDDARPVLVATVNKASLLEIIALAIEFKNAINNDTFYGAPAYSAKVQSITSGQRQFANGIGYYPMTIRIEFTNPDEFDGWDIRMNNEGPQCYKLKFGLPDDQGSENWILGPTKEMEKSGEYKLDGDIISKAYLDKDGFQLPPGYPAIVVPLLPGTENGTGSETDAWRIYYPKDFSLLGIGVAP